MSDQIAYFHLIEPVRLVLCRITLSALTISSEKAGLFGTDLEFGDG
ncbi:hypothetical protein [Pseudomonas sp. D2002]|nr:hypothetical protein [Pseudomonas sp. D2002]